MFRYCLKNSDPLAHEYYVYHTDRFSPIQFLKMYNQAVEAAPTKAEFDDNFVVEESEIIDRLCKLFGFTIKEEDDDEVVIITSNSLFRKVDLNEFEGKQLSRIIDISK